MPSIRRCENARTISLGRRSQPRRLACGPQRNKDTRRGFQNYILYKPSDELMGASNPYRNIGDWIVYGHIQIPGVLGSEPQRCFRCHSRTGDYGTAFWHLSMHGLRCGGSIKPDAATAPTKPPPTQPTTWHYTMAVNCVCGPSAAGLDPCRLGTTDQSEKGRGKHGIRDIRLRTRRSPTSPTHPWRWRPSR
jgi:hypothetical protein